MLYLLHKGLTVVLKTSHHIANAAETNNSNFATILYDNSSSQALTTYQPAANATNKIIFNYYVVGLYGNDCVVRIVSYVRANNLQLSLVDLRCACFGICEPPLAPNPGAAAWIQASLLASYSDVVAPVLKYFETNAVFIVITGLVVVLGLIGQ